MPYLSGVLTGILLTIILVFVIDHVNDDPGSQDIVNWGLVADGLGNTVADVNEQVREEVHEATAPEAETPASEPATPEPVTATPPATTDDTDDMP
ncbi:MAG TPA: hypothetical protein VMW68_06390 [Methyloceanibacter sp.]|nr:hypothetical protein [Methyloceanibacter sp.]